jgi:hypothetical protein
MGTEYFKRGIRGMKSARFSSGLTVDTGGATVSKGGVTISSGGLDDALQALTTTGTAVNFGITTLASSSGTVTGSLAAPAAGVFKSIACIQGAAAQTWAITCAAGTSFYSSASTAATLRKATFNAANEALFLVGLSTTKWMILANTGSVSIGTT